MCFCCLVHHLALWKDSAESFLGECWILWVISNDSDLGYLASYCHKVFLLMSNKACCQTLKADAYSHEKVRQVSIIPWPFGFESKSRQYTLPWKVSLDGYLSIGYQRQALRHSGRSRDMAVLFLVDASVWRMLESMSWPEISSSNPFQDLCNALQRWQIQ